VNMSTGDFALRRSTQPYQALAIILFSVTLLAAVTSYQQHDWSPIAAMGIGWLLFGAIVFIGTRYRVWWKSSGLITQRVANCAITAIHVHEITRIEQETSDLSTLVSLRRPFRRIAIYAGHAHTPKFIDVSLKHFVAADIRKLMRRLHEQRPDLVLPKNWV
jgi:hypothetical protein